MKFSTLILLSFLLLLNASILAQEKRLVGRINGKKIYLMQNKMAKTSVHYGTYLFVLNDTTITSQDLNCFSGYNIEGDNKEGCFTIYENRILQVLGPFGDEYPFLEKINFEKYTNSNGYFQQLIIPFAFSDSRFGSHKTHISRVFIWDEKEKKFNLKNEIRTDAFNERVAEVQGLLFWGDYNAALEKIKQKTFYEVWEVYPGKCYNYFYPQNLFLDFVDYTYKYSLEKFKNGDTTEAAKLVFNLLNEPLLKYARKIPEDSNTVILPTLAPADTVDQYNVNLINPCQKIYLTYLDWANNLKHGYLLFYTDSIKFQFSDGIKYVSSYDFIPNDAEYTTKLNDFAYFLEIGGYDSLAIVILEQIIYHHPKRAVAYLNLADALYDFGEKSKAKQYYQNYITLCKKNKMETKVPERIVDRIKP